MTESNAASSSVVVEMDGKIPAFVHEHIDAAVEDLEGLSCEPPDCRGRPREIGGHEVGQAA
jgi:hypothetical protein